MADYGLKISKKFINATTNEKRNLHFNSEDATYLVGKTITISVDSDPEVVTHGLGYIPKVFVYHVMSGHNRKLPYNDGSGTRDFSITKDDIKIRGTTSGTYKVYFFAPDIF